MSGRQQNNSNLREPVGPGVFAVASGDEKSMVTLGRMLGRSLTRGGVVYLSGDLGAGKTTLCRGVLQELGHDSYVKSPTYTLVEPYNLSDRTVYHFDLYRLADPEELEYIGIRDYFDTRNFGKTGVANYQLCLIEWPERGRGFLPEPDIAIQVMICEEGRRVVCNAGTEYGVKIIKALKEIAGE